MVIGDGRKGSQGKDGERVRRGGNAGEGRGEGGMVWVTGGEERRTKPGRTVLPPPPNTAEGRREEGLGWCGERQGGAGGVGWG